MIFFDTTFIIGVLDPRDQLHARAAAWSAVIEEPLVITEYVNWECLNYFSTPPDRHKIQLAAEQFQCDAAYEIVWSSRELFDAGLQMYEKLSDKTWSFTDCVSIGVMRQRRLTRALTFDRHFEQAGVEALLRRDPPN